MILVKQLHEPKYVNSYILKNKSVQQKHITAIQT